jgi:hypothetical protein
LSHCRKAEVNVAGDGFGPCEGLTTSIASAETLTRSAAMTVAAVTKLLMSLLLLRGNEVHVLASRIALRNSEMNERFAQS